MKITINSAHKSIPSNVTFEIPKFTVLTGENGSGKSHLFEAIKNKETTIELNNKKLKNINYIPFGALTPSIIKECDPLEITNAVKDIFSVLVKKKESMGVMFTLFSVMNAKPEDDMIYKNLPEGLYKKILLQISKKTNINVSKLTKEDIAENIDVHYLKDSSEKPSDNISEYNVFDSHIAMIFKSYHVHLIDNLMNKVYAEIDNNSAYQELNPIEFINKYGVAPWDYINSIFTKLNLPYKTNNPIGSKRETTFKFKLMHYTSEIEIDTNNLSTGEKTLMSIALAIYNATTSPVKIDLLILDEPDAALHPSMAKLMLEIIQEDIVNKSGIPVILSTHSPTTIACAPPSSLYKISSTTKVPSQCNLQDSIKILTYGIPNLRVSIEKRRQVFVESSYDVIYYEKLFNMISRTYKFETAPQFLPPHNQNGTNCEAVISITNTLRSMGNTQVYGLIDWDRKNKPSIQIVVLGLGKRYAIENYIFEPHLIGLYLIRNDFVKPSDLGLSKFNSYAEITSEINNNPDCLQTLASNIEEKLNLVESNDTLVDSELINGFQLKIRKEIMHMRGHNLEELYKRTWPKLLSIRSNNGGDSILKEDIINTVINDFPYLVSKDIQDTFNEFK